MNNTGTHEEQKSKGRVEVDLRKAEVRKTYS